ncbi:MAG: glycosyltransferase [Bacteroidota bacterium]
MSTASICALLNYAPHYRRAVYRRMQSSLPVDFFFGDRTAAEVKKMDYALLERPVQELRYRRLFGHFNWLSGTLRLLFRPYRAYLFTGEPYCVSTWLALLINKLRSKPTYLWSHGWYGDESAAKVRIKRLFFRLASGVFLYGNYARELMIAAGLDQNRLHVIYNSLDYEQQALLRSKLAAGTVYQDHFPHAAPTLVFIGRLTAVKRLSLLLEALAALAAEGKTYNLVLIGSGPRESTLQQQVAELQLHSQVWFYGACYEESEIAQLLFDADLCVSPGNVGLTALHALAYGTPVITHDNFSRQMPEFEAIVPRESGDFFQEGSSESLAATLEDWFTRYPEKTETLRERCWQKIESVYHPEFQVELLRKVILTDG